MDRLETMKTFLAVVQEGSFSRAADKLTMSPQLVSKYVSALEEALHIRLLNRTTRKVSITEAGQVYYQRCLQVISDIEEMENSLTDLSQHVSGVLNISAPMSFGSRHLAGLLTEFQKKYPDVELNLQLTDKKVDIVEEGIDVALRIGMLKTSSLIARKVAPVRIAVVASPGYLKKFGTPEKPEDLSSHHYLHYSYADLSMQFPGSSLRLADLRLESRFTTNNGDLLVEAAANDGGIVIQPTFIAGEALSEGRLVRVLEEYEPEPMGVYMVYANRKFLPGKVRHFVDFVAGYYGDTPYWDRP